MNKIDWKVIVLLGVILSVVVGFLFGTGILGGDASAPGSETDPLITQSYADKTITEKVVALEAQVEELTLKTQVLENDLTELYTMVNKKPMTPTSGATTGDASTGTPAAPETPPTSNKVSADNIGKSAGIAKGNNIVNLRKAANTSSEIVKKLSQNDSFKITKVDKEWYQVQLTDGTTGWVAGYLVAIK